MDQDQDGSANPATGVSRGQNRLHVLPEDWRAGAEMAAAQLDRLEASTMAAQLLVLTSDVESASGIAVALAVPAHERNLRILSATDTRRGARVLREAPAHVVVAPLDVAVALVQSATLKLEAVRAVVLAWLDARDTRVMSSLESLMADAPKDTPRIVFADAESPELDQLVERYARRASRVDADPGALASVSVEYVAASGVARLSTLRQLLDALDPESAFVVTTAPDSLERVQALLHSMGYPTGGAVRAGRTAPADARVVILFDVPTRAAELPGVPEGGTAAPRVIAIVTPRQVNALRRFTAGSLTPFALPDAAVRARSREDAVREELRGVLSEGRYARELLALEPLLTEYDGAEIAAAALRLLEAERSRPAAAAGRPSAAGAGAGGATTRLYINVGSMDNVRPADLVGAIVNEAGIARADVGNVEVRERFSTVDVATPVANTVVSKLTGVTIRGRRVVARVDEPARGARGDRDRGERSERPDRGDRSARGERGPRGDRGERGDRPRSTGRHRPFPKRT